MKQKLSTLLFVLAAALQSVFAALPTISTEGNEVWYYLKFTQGAYVVASTGEGAICTSALPSGKGAQLWKVEGTAAGYTFTNKLGLKLYYTATTQGSAVYAGAAPATNYRFKLTARGSYYCISPSTNTAQSLNCWGGMGLGNDIKFYDSSDANAPMEFVAEADVAASASLPLIPYPQSVTRGEGKLALSALTTIVYNHFDAQAPAERLAADLLATAGIKLEVKSAEGELPTAAGQITLTFDSTLTGEAYTLSVTADGITVKAGTFGGFFDALQTLRQLMPEAIYGTTLRADAAWQVPLVEIEDAPNLAKRGFHFDVSRHFFTVDEIKKLLDEAAIYKLNHFHWHLTDDQGWRIEIPEYPKLTTVGAVRSRSLILNDPTNGVDFYDDTEYGRGCFYTLDELRDVVAYAKERNIEILPEIDLPGHMVAAIAAYPWLSCDSTKTYEVRAAKGISTDVLNVGDDRVIDFLKCVLGHVAEVFPGNLIHIGGDECPTGVWTTSADCARRISEEGLSGVEDLQPWLAETLGNWLRETYGKNIVVWDELMSNWKDEYKTKPVIMAWNGLAKTAEAVNRGLSAICVPTGPMYLDLLQVAPSKMEIDAPYMGGYGDGSINSIDKIYALNPLTNVSDDNKHMVLGTQGNLWTESCHNIEAAEYCLYPRLLAVSETGWLPAAKKDFSDFYVRMQPHAKILKAKGVNHAPYYFDADELTADEALAAEADAILADAKPGTVGHPSKEAYDALAATVANGADSETLAAALEAYKVAPVMLPEAGKNYRIRSASIYWRQNYEGSSIYADGSKLKFHFTPQAEPEELFTFIPQGDNRFQISSVTGGGIVTLGTSGSGASLNESLGSVFSIQAAPRGTGKYTYIPGVLTLKAGSTLLFAATSGVVVAGTDSTLCYPGTWTIEEVTDYTAWLESLVAKCDRILADSQPGKMGEPSEEALLFLEEQLVTPAKATLAQGAVDKAGYDAYVALYTQFLQMPRASVADGINTTHYYYIRNAYHTTRYAAADASGLVLPKTLNTSDDAFRWRFEKKADGTVNIINKFTNTAAYVRADVDTASVLVGHPYDWTLAEVTTDQGSTAIAITDGTHAYSWYTNPSAWPHILLKPYDWGASIWTLEEIKNDLTPVGNIKIEPRRSTRFYDLHGRSVTKPGRGIYVSATGQKMVY